MGALDRIGNLKYTQVCRILREIEERQVRPGVWQVVVWCFRQEGLFSILQYTLFKYNTCCPRKV